MLPIHPTTTGSKLGANSWPHQRRDSWLHLIHEFGSKDIAFIFCKWRIIMIQGENFWSIWRSGLMMRCSDTSISNISDEALPLVSVFLWGIPSHPIASSPGRVLLGGWDAILEQGWSPSLIFGSPQLCESVPGHILDHLCDHQHQDQFEAKL